MDEVRTLEPPYTVGSVDTALRLLLLLSDRQEVRIADAGRELGVSRSTAHRIMRMLVKYGFAAQNASSRTYRRGPSWSMLDEHPIDPMLSRVIGATLDELARNTGETAQLLHLRPNGLVACVMAAEGTSIVRARARLGEVLPAARTAGGRILLGMLPATSRTTIEDVDDVEIAAAIERAGATGESIQHDELEPGTSAVAVAVRVAPDRLASIDIVLPSSRLTPDAATSLLTLARASATRIESAMERMTSGDDGEERG